VTVAMGTKKKLRPVGSVASRPEMPKQFGCISVASWWLRQARPLNFLWQRRNQANDYLELTRLLCLKIPSEWSNRLEESVLHNVVSQCHTITTFGSLRLTTPASNRVPLTSLWALRRVSRTSDPLLPELSPTLACAVLVLGSRPKRFHLWSPYAYE